MRLAVPLALAVAALVVAALAGCGGSTSSSPPQDPGPSSIAGVGAKTIAAGSARFRLSVTGSIGGVDVSADENGALSFTRQRAHIYKLLLAGGLPQELIIDGPFEYTNGDVQAAMNDPSVKPWTKLDTRRLTAKQRRASPNELAHVRAAAYLIQGVAHAVRLSGGASRTSHFRGVVDPARLAARLPAAVRASIMAAVRNDYVDTPFPADFWVDPAGRVSRVRVSYRTQGGGKITVVARYSAFGTPVKLGLPSAKGTQDITP